MIRILVYDDNINRRKSLEAFISFSPGFEQVGSFENCNRIESDIRETSPDIILMDIEMPGVDGISGVSIVKKVAPQVKVIMQTAFDDDDKVFAALQAGAEGYILKSASIDLIRQTITEVMNGGASMSPSIALKVMRYFSSKQEEVSGLDKLSAKENEVLQFLSTGLSYKMVADKMDISYFTVNNHVKRIYEKLQVHSLGEAVALLHKKKKLFSFFF